MDFEEFWEQNKLTLIFFGSVLLIFIIMTVMFFRFNGKSKYYEKKVISKQHRILLLKKYYEEYEKLKRNSNVTTEKQRLKGTLLSYFGGLTKKLGLEGKVSTMKPLRGDRNKRIIEIKLEKIMLEDAVKLIFEVEKKSNFAFKIKRFQIRKRVDHPDLLDMSLQVEAL